ncbi:DUF2690 domain-containing protein [Streptomyces sp. LARHCF252]
MYREEPPREGCGSGAKVIAKVSPAGGGPRVELRNSARCSAAWARIQKANESWRSKIEIRGGHSYPANASPSYEAYTQMVGRATPTAPAWNSTTVEGAAGPAPTGIDVLTAQRGPREGNDGPLGNGVRAPLTRGRRIG